MPSWNQSSLAVNNTVAGESSKIGGMKHVPTYHACILVVSCQISDFSVSHDIADRNLLDNAVYYFIKLNSIHFILFLMKNEDKGSVIFTIFALMLKN